MTAASPPPTREQARDLLRMLVDVAYGRPMPLALAVAAEHGEIERAWHAAHVHSLVETLDALRRAEERANASPRPWSRARRRASKAAQVATRATWLAGGDYATQDAAAADAVRATAPCPTLAAVLAAARRPA